MSKTIVESQLEQKDYHSRWWWLQSSGPPLDDNEDQNDYHSRGASLQQPTGGNSSYNNNAVAFDYTSQQSKYQYRIRFQCHQRLLNKAICEYTYKLK
jgi:hypothetical protein